MKRERIDGGPERKLLIGLITDTQLLASVHQFADPMLMESAYARSVVQWCVEYFKKYKKAPGIHIQDIFESNAEHLPKDRRELIKDLLSDLSSEYDRKHNVPYLTDQAEAFFRKLALDRVTAEARGLATEGKLDEAEGRLAGHRKLGRPRLTAKSMSDADGWREAFEDAEQPLFTWPGKLGEVFNQYCTRDQFIALTGPEKRGKTWWLNEFAIRAARGRCNVALFQLGDMSEKQIKRRLAARLCKGTTRANHRPLFLPVLDCRDCQLGECPKGQKVGCAIVDKWSIEAVHAAFAGGEYSGHRPCVRCMKEPDFRGSLWWKEQPPPEPIEWRDAFRAWSMFSARLRGRDFRLSVHAADQLSVSGLEAVLDSWESSDGFVPDVVVIDYADNMAAESGMGGKDERHVENKKWKGLRRVSQERHCLLVTATQSAGRSYNKASVDMTDYSEDKRKHGHVTAEYGLNQTPEEKRAGIMRIGVVVQREGEFFSDDEVYVAQCLRLGQPAVFSFK